MDPRRRIGLLISSPFSSIDVINPFMSTAAAAVDGMIYFYLDFVFFFVLFLF